jgi:hypothetical protein
MREQEKKKQLSFFFLFWQPTAPPSPSSSLSSLLSSGKSVAVLLSLPLFPDAANCCCSRSCSSTISYTFLPGVYIDRDTRSGGEDSSLFLCAQRRGQTPTKSSVKEPRLPGSLVVVVARRKVVRWTDRRTRDGLVCS